MPPIQERHLKQRAKLKHWLILRGWKKALQAMEFDAALEGDKKRKDGETPSLHHQVSIGRLIYTLAPHLLRPEQTIAVAFLHDVLEDYGEEIELDDFARTFGDEIYVATWATTKKYRGQEKPYDEYFPALADNPIASIVKLADRAHNIQTMQGVFTVDKQRAYIEEVSTWFFPLIRSARRNYPEQYDAYENLKILLRAQVTLLRQVLAVTVPGSQVRVAEPRHQGPPE